MPSAPSCQEKSIGPRAQYGSRALPQGWRWVRLGEVCDTQIEMVDLRRKEKGRFRYVDIASIDNARKLITQAKWLPCIEAPSRARQILKANDVMVSTTRPYLNAVAIVPPELDGQIGSTGFCVLRPFPDLDHEFLFAFVRSDVFIRGLSLRVKGALYPAVSNQVVREQSIPLPPLPEQKRIVGLLNERLAIVERARMAVQAQLDAANALPATFLRRVFPKPGQDLPCGWHFARLGEVCKVIGGSTPDSANPDFWDGKIVWVTPTDLGKNHAIVINSSSRNITVLGYDSCSTEMLPVGTVVMSSRAPIGHLAIAGSHLCTNQGCKSFIPGPSVHSQFLYWLLKWNLPAVQELGSGATFAEVSKSQLEQFRALLPPLPEQKRIAARLNEQIAAAARLRVNLEAQLAEIEALPAALLRKAFSGGL